MFYRCAISRAYYAAFHHARGIALADRSYGPDQNPKRHDHLVEVLRDYNGRIADEMDRFKDIRNMADYDEIVSGLAGKWNTAKQSVQRCLQHIQRKTP